ncbi:MAG: hypothetical protein ACOCSA_03090 [Candidatus Hadarchaeota archaeon]
MDTLEPTRKTINYFHPSLTEKGLFKGTGFLTRLGDHIMKIREYVDEFYGILAELENKNREGDFNEAEIALGILQERAKDRRMAAMENRRKSEKKEPASEKQKKYMDDLGVVYEEGITKEEASREIEKALDSKK